MSSLSDAVARIELRRWPWKITLHCTDIAPECLFISEVVRDRDTGEEITLGPIDCEAPPENLKGDGLVAWIYVKLQKHVLHELDEAFLVDGRRAFDPHEGK